MHICAHSMCLHADGPVHAALICAPLLVQVALIASRMGSIADVGLTGGDLVIIYKFCPAFALLLHM